MELLLQRFSTGDKSSLGILHQVDDPSDLVCSSTHRDFKCFTMEDQPNYPKVPGETRIPAGRYQIGRRVVGGMHMRYRHRFPWHQGMLWLLNVPDFTFVYIHTGNYHGHTDGCILVGDGCHSNTTGDGMVTGSVAAYVRLAQEIYQAQNTGKVWIRIEDFD